LHHLPIARNIPNDARAIGGPRWKFRVDVLWSSAPRTRERIVNRFRNTIRVNILTATADGHHCESGDQSDSALHRNSIDVERQPSARPGDTKKGRHPR
jgi:hypothetical protein